MANSPTEQPFFVDELSLEEVVSHLQEGTCDKDLEALFGMEQFKALQEQLGSSRNVATTRASREKVIIIPGIMGSQLGKRLRRDWDIVWMNPLAIIDGSFSRLSLGDGASRYGARGLMPLFYTMLWTRLKFWYRYDVQEFAYDWRGSVHDAANELVSYVDGLGGASVSIVAHSMGGLVARVASERLGSRLKRVIQLGTPNYGSFMPIATLCGQNEFVNRLLRLDRHSTPAALLASTVNTFVGLFELFPSPKKYGKVPLFDGQTWPSKLQVSKQVLNTAKDGIDRIPDPDDRFVLIAGDSQPTVTDLDVGADGGFQFKWTDRGDGTVPLNFARMDDKALKTYYVPASHTGMLSRADVAAAIDEILKSGTTTALSTTPLSSGREISERAGASVASRLSGTRATGDSSTSSKADIRVIQREILGPVEPDVPKIDDHSDCMWDGNIQNIVVSRKRRRMRLVLAYGDLTQMPAQAHVVGVFEGVTPTGPSRQFDELLQGAVGDLIGRGIFTGERGRICFLPTYKSSIPGELIAFAGLGNFKDFGVQRVQDTAHQVMLSLLKSRVTELATVVFGGSMSEVQQYLCCLLRGFLDGLREGDKLYDFNKLIICEKDHKNFEELKKELYRLAASSLFDDVELEFDVIELESQQRTLRASSLPQRDELPLVLYSRVSLDTTSKEIPEMYKHELAVLPPESGTTFSQYQIRFPKADLDQLINSVRNGAPDDLDAYGASLANLVLPGDFLSAFQSGLADSQVQLLHDALSSRIPWEAIRIGDVTPALRRGMFRKYERTRGASFIRQDLQQRDILRILLVSNPTKDLDGAEKEAERLQAVAASSNGLVRITHLSKGSATRRAILDQLADGEYDVLHYAGHAAFIPDDPAHSGLLCADRQVLSGNELAPLGSRLPPVIILNACQSGRVRRQSASNDMVYSPASAAEAILSAGIRCFIATYWPVSDDGAKIFADEFYGTVLQVMQRKVEKATVGSAVLTARSVMFAAKQDDWANYMLYGDPSYMIKTNPSSSN